MVGPINSCSSLIALSPQVGFKIYAQSYLFIGLMEMLCAMSMFFLYMWQDAGIPVGDMWLLYENWSDGFHGYTADELNSFLSTGQCVYFVTLVVLQIFNLFSVRSKRMSLLQANPLSKERRNLWLFVGPSESAKCLNLESACTDASSPRLTVISIAIALIVTLVPGIQNLFGTAAVPVRFWFIPVGLGLGILIMDELRKLTVRTWPSGPVARLAW